MKQKYLLEVIAKGSYYTAQEICEMENISADTFRDTIKSLGIKPATWGAQTIECHKK